MKSFLLSLVTCVLALTLQIGCTKEKAQPSKTEAISVDASTMSGCIPQMDAFFATRPNFNGAIAKPWESVFSSDTTANGVYLRKYIKYFFDGTCSGADTTKHKVNPTSSDGLVYFWDANTISVPYTYDSAGQTKTCASYVAQTKEQLNYTDSVVTAWYAAQGVDYGGFTEPKPARIYIRQLNNLETWYVDGWTNARLPLSHPVLKSPYVEGQQKIYLYFVEK